MFLLSTFGLTFGFFFFSNSSQYIFATSLTSIFGISIKISVSRRHDVSRCRNTVRHFCPLTFQIWMKASRHASRKRKVSTKPLLTISAVLAGHILIPGFHSRRNPSAGIRHLVSPSPVLVYNFPHCSSRQSFLTFPTYQDDTLS